MGGGGSSLLTTPEADFVRSEVEKNCVVMFSKSYCQYCAASKRVFSELGVPVTVHELDRRPDGDVMQDVLNEMTGARSVPRVFINGKCVGGNSETQALDKSGKLTQMLQDCSQNNAS